MKNILFVASAALFLSACASPARYAWVKEGASDHQRTNDTSECTYQVRLNKTPVAEQKDKSKDSSKESEQLKEELAKENQQNNFSYLLL
jgi:hypothetical protein